MAGCLAFGTVEGRSVPFSAGTGGWVVRLAARALLSPTRRDRGPYSVLEFGLELLKLWLHQAWGGGGGAVGL